MARKSISEQIERNRLILIYAWECLKQGVKIQLKNQIFVIFIYFQSVWIDTNKKYCQKEPLKYLKIIWNLPSGVFFSIFSGVSEVIWPLILCKRVECVNWFQCKSNMHFYSACCLVVWLNGIPMCSEFHNEDWMVPRFCMSKKIKLIPTILITFCSS